MAYVFQTMETGGVSRERSDLDTPPVSMVHFHPPVLTRKAYSLLDQMLFVHSGETCLAPLDNQDGIYVLLGRIPARATAGGAFQFPDQTPLRAQGTRVSTDLLTLGPSAHYSTPFFMAGGALPAHR